MKYSILNMPSNERLAYIVMKRIKPMIIQNWIIRNGQVIGTNNNNDSIGIVSELGVYGVIIHDENNQLIENYAAGTLLRSKAASAEDGGVAAVVAVLDSPSLI